MNRISTSYHVRESLPDGQLLHIRTIRPSDRKVLHEAFHRLSKATVRDRFFNVKLDLTPQELTYFTEVDLACHVALVAEIEAGLQRRPVGVGRFVRSSERPDHCEFAITIADEFQGQGIGRALLKRLVDCARRLGIRQLDASVLPQNARMSHLLHGCGLPLESSLQNGVLTYSLTL
jgi:acetyltransferase